jgi:uncharacterized membrane protein
VTPRALGISLFASLALNLFLVGAILGGFVIGHRLHVAVMGSHPAAHPLWTAADTLPADHRQAFQALLRDQGMTVAVQIHQARRGRRDAWAGLMAQPFDAAGISKRLADARTLEMQARGGVEDKIVAFAATLPPDERARLAEGLAHSSPGPRGGMPRMHGPAMGDGPGPEN